MHQCGLTVPTDPAPNPSGIISWVNLLTETKRHEYNSPVPTPAQSHWAEYSISMNKSQNNPGDYVESQVALPNASGGLNSNTIAGITSRLNQILADTSVEPFYVNQDDTGQLLGNINYGPNYTTCN